MQNVNIVNVSKTLLKMLVKNARLPNTKNLLISVLLDQNVKATQNAVDEHDLNYQP